MIPDASTQVAGAVWRALTADPPIGAAVYDRVPEGAAYPQIEMAGGQGRDFSAALVRGEIVTVEIHVWSHYDGWLEARQLMAAVRERLDGMILPLTGATMVDQQYTDHDLMLDPDGLTRHGICRFNVTVTVP